MLSQFDRFSKNQKGFSEGYAERAAHRRAESMAEQFNEPAYILEGPEEFVVLRGIAWDARQTWGKDNLPAWAKSKPESLLRSTVMPVDKLKGNYAKATKIVKRMQKKTMDIRYDDRFDLEEICRDYSDVRQMSRLVESATEHLYSLLISLEFAVNSAIKEHKEKVNGD